MSDMRELIPELDLISVERTSPILVSEPKWVDSESIREKRREHLPRWIIRVLAASLTINMLQWVIIYVLQAGPI